MSRSQAREIAFKVLFKVDMVGGPPEECLKYLVRDCPLADKYLAFSRQLINNTLDNTEFIDTCISKYSPGWSVQRMAVVDRNLMRLAICEKFYMDIDAAIAINEAVELAKKYGDENSSSFINAILDKVMGGKSEISSRD